MLPNNSEIARLEHVEIVFFEGLTAADDAQPRLQQQDHPQKPVASVTGPSGGLKNLHLRFSCRFFYVFFLFSRWLHAMVNPDPAQVFCSLASRSFKILKLKIIYKFDIDEFLINQLQHNCSQFSWLIKYLAFWVSIWLPCGPCPLPARSMPNCLTLKSQN